MTSLSFHHVESHLAQLDRVFQRLREHDLMVNPAKTFLFQTEATYLGHRIDGEGVRPDSRLVNAVANYPVPHDKKALKTFLGLAGYYHHFIRNFAGIAAPLTDLTAKTTAWDWKEEHQAAFEELRRRLTERPVLAHPDFNRPFVVQTDYSSNAMGAVLSQRDDNGREHPVAYMSKKCVGRERHYSARRGEAVAIRKALRKWRCFLEGQHFFIETDHRPFRKEGDDAQLNRIWEALEGFHYTLRYKSVVHVAGEPVAEEREEESGDDIPDV